MGGITLCPYPGRWPPRKRRKIPERVLWGWRHSGNYRGDRVSQGTADPDARLASKPWCSSQTAVASQTSYRIPGYGGAVDSPCRKKRMNRNGQEWVPFLSACYIPGLMLKWICWNGNNAPNTVELLQRREFLNPKPQSIFSPLANCLLITALKNNRN